MTKLDLANKFLRKAGVPGTLTTTIDLSGELGDMIDWLDQAYQMVQDHYDTWLFLREEFTFDTVSGTSVYSATSIKADYGSWRDDDFRCYLTSLGVTNEQYINYYEWADFRQTFLFSSSRNTTGRPIYFTIQPDKSIQVHPIPDDIYTIGGEYYKTPDTMDLDTDEPNFPERYQWVIIWKALALYGADSDEPNKEFTGNKYYREFINRMSQELLSEFNMGGPLA